MSGVCQISGQKKVTQKMIDRQRLVARTENDRLDLMINLFNSAGHSTKDIDLTRPEPAEPAALLGSFSELNMRETE